MPFWLDETGQRLPSHPCAKCGREVPATRYRADTMRRHGWTPDVPLFVIEWCGCRRDFVLRPEAGGWWRMVPVADI